jgi:hypothetical protein
MDCFDGIITFFDVEKQGIILFLKTWLKNYEDFIV